ncbi:MAG: ATP synthase F1 subunit epsilon [Alphaproteobacteria bacterium]|nr:ATP synthase F1 subunit epsilon [Alphaproteobacteria bacterium]
MSDKITIRLITPEKQLFTKEIDSAVLPGHKGAFSVLPKRAPLVAQLVPGILLMRTGSGEEGYFITSGIAEVSDNNCNVLVETAIAKDKVNQEALATKLQELKDAAAQQEAGLISLELEDHIAFIEMILAEVAKDKD